MKQAQMPIIAFGLFFATKFATARYLLVEIDDGADGTRPNYPSGRRCEPLIDNTKCKNAEGAAELAESVTAEECQEKCEKYETGKWGCCEYQEDNNAKCLFYDSSLEEVPGTAPYTRKAAQCGGEDFHYHPNAACMGHYITSEATADLAMSACKTNPNCKCVRDVNCDHTAFRLYDNVPSRDASDCAWNKRGKIDEQCEDDLDCLAPMVCYDHACNYPI